MTMHPHSTVTDFPLRLMVHHAGGSYDLTFFLNLPAAKAARIITFARQVSAGYGDPQSTVSKFVKYVDDLPYSHDKFNLWSEGLAGNHIQFEAVNHSGAAALESVLDKVGQLLTAGEGDVMLADHRNTDMPNAFIKKHVLPKNGQLPGLGAPLKPEPVRLKQYEPGDFAYFLGRLIQAERTGGIEKLGLGS